MENVTFRVLNKNNKVFKFTIDKYTVGDVRKELCDEYDNKDKFCKIECVLEYPVRKFGILTLNPGVLGDIYDKERLDRFNIGGKTINININFETKKIENRQKINLKASHSRFRFKNKEYKEEKKEFNFNEDDFPPLC